MSPTEYREKTRVLINKIHAYDYYVKLWNGTLNGVSEEAFLNQNVETICNQLNDFWFALPDNGAIRREPFFLLCELAEFEF